MKVVSIRKCDPPIPRAVYLHLALLLVAFIIAMVAIAFILDKSWIKLLLEGRWFMIPLLTCSIVSLGVIVERLVTLRAAEIDTASLNARIARLVRADRAKEAELLCESTPGPVAEVLTVGLRKLRMLAALGRPTEAVEGGVVKAMEDYAIHVISQLEKYLVILATVGNVAPLFGFAGTVTGMIDAFGRIREAKGMDPAMVAGGISEALITTAAGLLVGIPAVIFYNYFTTRVQGLMLDVEEGATDLVKTVAAGRRASEPASVEAAEPGAVAEAAAPLPQEQPA